MEEQINVLINALLAIFALIAGFFVRIPKKTVTQEVTKRITIK